MLLGQGVWLPPCRSAECAPLLQCQAVREEFLSGAALGEELCPVPAAERHPGVHGCNAATLGPGASLALVALHAACSRQRCHGVTLLGQIITLTQPGSITIHEKFNIGHRGCGSGWHSALLVTRASGAPRPPTLRCMPCPPWYNMSHLLQHAHQGSSVCDVCSALVSASLAQLT